MTSNPRTKNNDVAPHYVGHRKRLRERFKKAPEAFHDYELLELLLAYSIPRVDTKERAKALLEKFGALPAVLNAPFEDLVSVPGISGNSAVLIRLAGELNVKREATEMTSKKRLSTPSEALSFARSKLEGQSDEAFPAIYLNARNRVPAYEMVNEGTVNRAVVYPRNVVRGALDNNASALILAHNHPSGECEPSAHDISLTEAISAALKTIDVEVLDHVIIGTGKHFSFAEEKLL